MSLASVLTPGPVHAQPGRAVALYARERPGRAERLQATLQLLREAAAGHGGRIALATSLSAEDMVLTDLIARERLPVALLMLDTGKLHAETLALAARVETHYGLAIERWAPPQEAVLQFVRQRGERVMYHSLEGRKACCALRKLQPLQRALAGRSAWITGQRREHSEGRAELALRETDDAGRAKFNPLADWAWADVWQHIAEHGVPHNPLHDAFMPSIGCAPCTRAIALGEPFRAGRWWWEQGGAKECGLHVSAPAAGSEDALETATETPR